jgi:hypothetical protein
MKRADLEKQLGKKIAGRMQHEPQADRYGTASSSVGDKREQRERDKAAGLVPFAVKLPQALVARLQALAVERNASLNELTAKLLESSIDASTTGASTRDADSAVTATEAAAPNARDEQAPAKAKAARSRKSA